MKIIRECDAEGEVIAPPFARVIKHLAAPWTLGTKNIWLGVSKIKVDGKSNPHSHDLEEVFYVISGRGKIIVENEESDIEQGSCIYIPPNATHQLINTYDETLFVLAATSPPFEPAKFRAIHKAKE